jgi:hypothetical protein
MDRFHSGIVEVARKIIVIAACLGCVPLASASLLGVDRETGALYSISETTAAVTFIGNTGITNSWAEIEFAPNGTLYGFTDNGAATPSLYSIDPSTAAATLIGALNAGDFIFEGALAFAPDGTAYAMNIGSNGNAQLFNINLATGAATALGVVSGVFDINGLAYRSDGMLIGLDDNTSSLYVINPVTLTASLLAAVPTTVGAIGGMTIESGVGFYATGGPNTSAPGSDNLYSFDLLTGASTLIGNLGFTDSGLSGLAAAPGRAPEPSTWALLLVALVALFLWTGIRSRSTRAREVVAR